MVRRRLKEAEARRESVVRYGLRLQDGMKMKRTEPLRLLSHHCDQGSETYGELLKQCEQF